MEGQIEFRKSRIVTDEMLCAIVESTIPDAKFGGFDKDENGRERIFFDVVDGISFTIYKNITLADLGCKISKILIEDGIAIGKDRKINELRGVLKIGKI